MPSTVYKGDLAEVAFGHETGIVLTHGAWGGLTWSHTTVANSDISKITFANANERTVSTVNCSMFDGSSQLKYPTGLLAGTKLRIKGSGAFSADDHTKGRLYTIVHNQGDYIQVTPSLATTPATTSTVGDELLIGTLGTPTMDTQMGYNSSPDLSDETALTDQFVGLAATITFPETKVEVLRQHVVGIGRDVVVQEPQKFTNEGGTIETMMHSARWFYYALGNEAVVSPSTVSSVIDSANASAIAMGDTYVGFSDSASLASAVLPGDYIVVVDDVVSEVLTPMDSDPGEGNRDIFGTTGNETQFHASQRNEMRRVIAVDNTALYKRIYVDDPFNFDHSAASNVKRILADDSTNVQSTDGSPSFDPSTASYGNILNRQKRAFWSMWHQPSFSLETSIRTRNVDSYGSGGYAGSQTTNAPGTAGDSKQLTRLYKGCKVKNWNLTADADSQVKMKVDFDALMCYTDTGRLEDDSAATATITITDFTELNAGDKVNLVATDGTNYDFTCGDQSSVSGTWESTTSNNATASNLMNVINTSSGPSGTRFTATVLNAVVTVTQATVGSDGNTTVTLTDGGTAGMSRTNFTGGTSSGDRFTAHRMFENIANGPKERKIAGIAPNTEKPYFYYNGTITGFGTTIAQVTSFSLTGATNTTAVITVGANPLSESRNTIGQSLEQIPFAGSRNPSLNIEGKVEYTLDLEIIPSDPLLWHEYRTNRTHGYSEPITLHLRKNGAGANREEVYVIIDDYIIEEVTLSIPEDKTQIKLPMKILPKHVKVVAYDTLFHA